MIIRILFLPLVLMVANCSNLTNTGKYQTINLPISNHIESNPTNVINNSSESSLSLQQNNQNNAKIIKEQRNNGNIVQIKVDNNNRLPNYYVYPSQQEKLNINNNPDKNVATPSWQINW
jgi:hypothetical protein